MTGDLDITILDLMDAIASRHAPTRPPNSFTKRQFISRTGLTHYKASQALADEVRSGNLCVGSFPRSDGSGGLEKVYWEP